jgi:hypothetical protein|tara:strand:+ start:559 stop:759 length:201 start_codon:yes stop_codon:yes gene_type:complete
MMAPDELIEIDEPDDWNDITDRIERSLWEIMNEWNLPKDEIKKAVFSRRISRENNEFDPRTKKIEI